MSGNSDTAVAGHGEEAAATLEFVKLGDHILLTGGGMMIGDSALGRVGVQQPRKDDAPSLQQHECVFEICPMLSYRAKKDLIREQNELDKRADEAGALSSIPEDKSKSKDQGSTATSHSTLGSIRNALSNGFGVVGPAMTGSDSDSSDEEDNEDAGDQLEELTRSAENEVRQNNVTLKERLGEIVQYGDVVQLRHVESDLFLKMRSKRAPLDKECKSVVLAEGSLSSYFRLKPRFKTRSLGTPVYFDDEIMIVSVKQDPLFLHASKLKSYPAAVIDPTDELVDSDNLGTSIPRSLCSPEVREVNGSRDFFSFRINLYSRVDKNDPDENNALRTWSTFRLFHPEADSFLVASGDPEKAGSGSGDNSTAMLLRSDGVTPAHIPYLKAMNGKDINNVEQLSAKGLWVFENPNRSVGSSIPWTNSPVRIRHAVSGKYLSCQTSKEDRKGYFQVALCFDIDLSAAAGDFGSEESLLFYILPMEKTEEDNLPNATSTVRIEHRHIDGRHLHLNHIWLPKAPLKSTKILESHKKGGTRIMFSLTQSAEDMLKLIPTTREEKLLINKIVSKRSHIDSCRWRMENARSVPNELVGPCISLVLRLLDDMTRGQSIRKDLRSLTIGEWVKKANSMLPSKFSMLFMSTAVAHVQEKIVDCKLMDRLFTLACAPYNRFLRINDAGDIHATLPRLEKLNPWSEDGKSRRSMEKAKALQKIAHVALQTGFVSNDATKNYFARRKCRMLFVSETCTVACQELKWTKVIASQSEDPLGATVTLAKLVIDNEKLMKDVIDEALLKKLRQLIMDFGPQPRFLKLFESICSAQRRPLIANQEATLRLLWMDPVFRQKLLIDLTPLETDEGGKTVPCKPGVQGIMKEGDSLPSDFLGYHETLKGETFPEIFCSWSGSPSWESRLPELFWDASSLELPEDISKKGVKLEHLCWVLQPRDLCLKVTGKAWEDPLSPASQNESRKSPTNSKTLVRKQSTFNDFSKSKNSEEAALRLSRHQQLADWFVAQLQLFNALATGRSYNVIKVLDKVLTYPMLLSMAYNRKLPSIVRACALDLVRVLFVDRYPQLKHSGKPIVPQKLWVFDDPEGCDQGCCVALVRPRSLDNDDALPGFLLSDGHEFDKHEEFSDPVFRFRTNTKFFLLRKMTNHIVSELAETIAHSEREKNLLLLSILKVSSKLLDFGFQSTLPKLQEFCHVVGILLDGRRDAAKPNIPFQPSFARYKENGREFLTVARLKCTAIEVLMNVSDLRADYRLGKMLWLFKDKYLNYLKDQSGPGGRGTASVTPVIDAVQPAEGTDSANEEKLEVESSFNIETAIFEDFEALFEAGRGDDAPLLDLGALTGKGKDVGDILRDCIMYEDDDLFESALNLLDRRFGQRRKLLGALSAVQLLETPQLEVFGNVNKLLSRIEYCIFILRSTQQWGVKSRLSGPFDNSRFNFLVETCEELLDFLPQNLEKPEQYHRQRILSSLSLGNTLAEGLRMDPNLSFKGSICEEADKLKSQNILLKSLQNILMVTEKYVISNLENQGEFFSHLIKICEIGTLELIRPVEATPQEFESEIQVNQELCDAVKQQAKLVIMEVVRSNEQVCSALVESAEKFRPIFNIFMQDLCDAKDPSLLDTELQFFLNVINPQGKILARNQNYIMKVMELGRGHDFFRRIRSIFCSGVSSQTEISKPERLMKLITALIDGKNESIAEKFANDYFSASAGESAAEGDKFALNTKRCLVLLDVLFNQQFQNVDEAKNRNSSNLIVVVEALAIFTVKLIKCRSIDPDTLIQSKEMWHLFDENLEALFTDFKARKEAKQLTTCLVTECLEIFHNCLLSAAANSLLENIFEDHRETIMSIATHAQDILSMVSKTGTRENLTLAEAAVHVLQSSGKDENAEVPSLPVKSTFGRLKNVISATGVKSNLDCSENIEHYLSEFKTIVIENIHIKEKVTLRRFALVDCLERENSEDENPEDTAPSWNQILRRFASFGLRNYHRPQRTMIMIKMFDVLYFSLLKARQDESTGTVMDVSSLSETKLRFFQAKQSAMVKNGIGKVVFTTICHTEASLRDNSVCAAAFRLGIEMIRSANLDVQKQINDSSVYEDIEGLFHENFRQRISMIRNAIIHHQEDLISNDESNHQKISEYNRHIEYALETFQYLQLIVEGHNETMQNLLRTQPNHISNIDLLSEAIQTVLQLCSNSSIIADLSIKEMKLSKKILDFISECCWGPCAENQSSVAKSDAILVVKSILNVKPATILTKHNDENNQEMNDTIVGLKISAVTVLASILEGRENYELHDVLAGKLEPLSALLLPIQKRLKRNANTILHKEGVVSRTSKEMLEVTLDGLAKIKAVHESLNIVKEIKQGASKEKIEKAQNEDETAFVGFVDIFWRGKTYKAYFPLPIERHFLTDTAKEEVLQKVDVTMTHDRRMKEFIYYGENITCDLKVIYENARKSSIYYVLHKNGILVRNVTYVIVILLNCNIIMAANELRYPLSTLVQCGPRGHAGEQGSLFCDLKSEFRMPLAITFILGIMIFCGYFVMIIIHGVTEIPSVVKNTKEKRDADLRKKHTDGTNNCFFDWRKLIPPAAFTILSLVFVLEQTFRYAHVIAQTSILLAFIIIAWVLRSIRAAISIPDNHISFSFIVLYDSLIGRRFTRNHFILLGILTLGFYDSQYFTFLLFDVFNISRDLQDILTSITDSGRGLLLVGFTIIISLIVFATIANHHIKNAFDHEDADEQDFPNFDCSSPVRCFFFLGLKAFPYGMTEEIMEPVDYDDASFYFRSAFDLVFFVWIGILLFNIITGLVLDAFGSKREASGERTRIMENECFVCGITRVNFKDLNLPAGEDSFEAHVEQEHNFWHYLYFVQALQKKHKSEYTGIESYVAEEINVGRYSWLPKASSHTIERYTRTLVEEESVSDQVTNLSTKLESMQSWLDDFEEEISKKLEAVLGRVSD